MQSLTVYKIRRYVNGEKLPGDFQPERIKSVDSKTVAKNTIRTRRQTDRRASFETFSYSSTPKRDLLYQPKMGVI